MTCYRRRLYLSCVNLLGAVNEAAWYAAGEKHPRPDSGLQQALANDRTAEVLKRVTETSSGQLLARSRFYLLRLQEMTEKAVRRTTGVPSSK